MSVDFGSDLDDLISSLNIELFYKKHDDVGILKRTAV